MVVEMVDGIGIVPVDPEILGRRFQSGKPAHRIVGVGDPLRIGVLGHTPDPLDSLVSRHQLFHHIHIRPHVCHGYVDHVDTEIFRDGKMPVISRHRAEEFHFIQPAPRRAAHDPVSHGPGNRIIHDVQTGVSVDDDLIRMDLHHVCQQLLGLADAIQNTVVAAVCSVVTGQVVVTA